MDVESYRLWLEEEKARKSEFVKTNEELLGCDLRVLGLGDYCVSEIQNGRPGPLLESEFREEILNRHLIQKCWGLISYAQLRLSTVSDKIWKTDYSFSRFRHHIQVQRRTTELICFGAPQSDLFLRFLFLERFQDVNLVEELISFLPFGMDNVYCIWKSCGLKYGKDPYFVFIGVEGNRLFYMSPKQIESKIKESKDPNWKSLRKMIRKTCKKRTKISKEFKLRKKGKKRKKKIK